GLAAGQVPVEVLLLSRRGLGVIDLKAVLRKGGQQLADGGQGLKGQVHQNLPVESAHAGVRHRCHRRQDRLAEVVPVAPQGAVGGGELSEGGALSRAAAVLGSVVV